MRCCLKFGGIIQFWHCILVVAFQSYVLVRNVFNYITLRSQTFDARHGLDWDTAPLHFFVNCIVLSAAFTLVMAFLLCANRDYFIIGSISLKTSRLSVALDNSSNRTNSISPPHKRQTFLSRKRYGDLFPLAFLFHVLGAYFLLLPAPWILGEQARNEAINPKLVWQTDLSFIFPTLSPKEVMKNTRARHPELASKLAASGLPSTRLTGSDLLAVQPPTLGGIGQLPQTRQQESTVADLKAAILQHSNGIKTGFVENHAHIGRGNLQRSPSPEIVNFFLALAFLGIRIATTFWTVWPTFAYLSSILLIASGVYLTLEYAAISLLVQLSTCLTAHVNTSDIYGSLIMVRLPMRLTAWQMILITALDCASTLAGYGILFHLGVRQFYKAVEKNYYTVANVLRITKSPTNGLSEQTTTLTPCSEPESLEGKKRCSFCHCWPLRNRALIILGFFSFLLSILIRMPCLYDIFLLYWNEKDYLCLTTVILFVCVHLAWLMMWFGFAMKQKWNFHIIYPRAMPPCTEPSIQNAFLAEPGLQSRLVYTPIPECNDEEAVPLQNPTFFSPLQLENSDVSLATPICLTSAHMYAPPNSMKYALRVPTPQEVTTGHVMANKLYETSVPNYRVSTPASESFALQGHYLLAPTANKYASVRRLNTWESEIPGGRQKVIVNVTETASPGQVLRGPRTISGETARSSDTRPRSLPLQSSDGVEGGGGGLIGSALLKAAPMAVPESGRSTATSGDQICSQV